jgi:hypothetical protein
MGCACSHTASTATATDFFATATAACYNEPIHITRTTSHIELA